MALVALGLLTACGGSGSSRTDGGDGGGGGGDAAAVEAGGGGDSSTATGATFGSGSNFGSVRSYFTYINGKRNSYSTHSRWKGFPFAGGKTHKNVTWPYTMKWSDTATVAAQKEADAVAKGGTPTGKKSYNNPGQLPIYISGLNTADYMVGGKERPGSFTTSTCTMCNANPFMRMAVFYHDPGGDGPVLTSIGLGAADMGDGSTWWVIRFAK